MRIAPNYSRFSYSMHGILRRFIFYQNFRRNSFCTGKFTDRFAVEIVCAFFCVSLSAVFFNAEEVGVRGIETREKSGERGRSEGESGVG